MEKLHARRPLFFFWVHYTLIDIFVNWELLEFSCLILVYSYGFLNLTNLCNIFFLELIYVEFVLYSQRIDY